MHVAPVMPFETTAGLPVPVAATLRRLRAVLPAQADAAQALLTQLLAPLAASAWPEMAWRFSSLTNTGLPVEFAWTSREAAVRWTAEVAAPETDDGERLAIAARALDWPGGVLPASASSGDASLNGSTTIGSLPACPSPADLTMWLAHQRDCRLNFGAWASARHGEAAAGQPATLMPATLKLYADLPSGRLPAAWRGRHALLNSTLLFWRMAGVNPDGSVEFYARSHDLDRNGLAALARSLLGDDAPLLDQLTALVADSDLPRPSGLSVALSANGEPRALTWFTFAKAIFRDDAQTHAALRGLGSGVSAQVYEALASGPEDGRWRHGMVGVGADITGKAWVQCGVRPT